MATIRVLQVFTIMNRGGAESMIMNYYRQINRDKIQFDFLVHRKEKAAFDDEIESLGGKVYRMNPINPMMPGSYYEQLRSFLKEHNEYAIIHSHLNTFSCFPLKIAKEFKIPCRIAHAHIAIDDISVFSLFSRKESIKETFKKLIKLQLKKKVKKDATHLFSCGEKAGDWLFGRGASYTMMNNAIDTSKFVYEEAIALEYKKQFKLEDTLVIGHIGRFASQKNHAFLVEVFNSLVKKKPNSVLMLVGDGPLRKGIENEVKELGIADKVYFLGIRADIPKLFQMFDAFVFPSFYEGLPVALIEAQSAGVKIVASDTITEEVHLTEDVTFLSLEKSATVWAETILKNGSSQKSDNTNKIIKGNYDIVSNTKMIEAFYTKQTVI